jgi:glucose dehydrogenase
MRPGDNKWANSVVALSAQTGELVWGFQLVHHDLWDYDTAAQPVLGTLRRNGVEMPVVIQGNKTGNLFVLDRRTGKPVFGVEERSVPKSDADDETASPTQPFPLAPPPLVHQHRLIADDAWGAAAPSIRSGKTSSRMFSTFRWRSISYRVISTREMSRWQRRAHSAPRSPLACGPRLRRLTALTGPGTQPSFATKSSTARSGFPLGP